MRFTLANVPLSAIATDRGVSVVQGETEAFEVVHGHKVAALRVVSDPSATAVAEIALATHSPCSSCSTRRTTA